jgi:hypothetical protein
LARAPIHIEHGVPGGGGLRIDQIIAATALGHIELRYTKDWRGRCPKLTVWYDAFSQ